jgi:hypothetical protein
MQAAALFLMAKAFLAAFSQIIHKQANTWGHRIVVNIREYHSSDMNLSADGIVPAHAEGGKAASAAQIWNC